MQTDNATATSSAGAPYLARHEPQQLISVLADAGRTSGALGIVACDLQAGERHGWYRHATEDVGFLVLDGTVELRCAEQTWVATPVSLVSINHPPCKSVASLSGGLTMRISMGSPRLAPGPMIP